MKLNMIKKFIYWISERHNIYLKKELMYEFPWTKDKILQEFKFTNPFRENDRVTKELRKRIKAQKTKRNKKGDDMYTTFNKIIIFRMFNWPETYDALEEAGMIENWNTRKAASILNKRKKNGHKVFTGAYIITNNGKTEGKIELVCKAVGKMLKDSNKIVTAMVLHNSLEQAVAILKTYSMVGDFIGYELVTDLRHTRILNTASDIFTWANPGPGAKRGMHRILFDTERGSLPKGKKVDYQETMRLLASTAQIELGSTKSFSDVTFEMRDVEHSLCEFDKYMRVKNGEGKPRSKYTYKGE